MMQWKPYSDVSEVISATATEKVKDCSQVRTGDVRPELEAGLVPELAVSGRVA